MKESKARKQVAEPVSAHVCVLKWASHSSEIPIVTELCLPQNLAISLYKIPGSHDGD
jgi:hypothetical protein